MMNLSSRAAIAAFASLLLLGAASAQTPAPAPATKSAPAKMAPAETKADKPRTAASLDCSKQADAKGLHGTERRKFRSECKKTSKVN